MVRKLLPVKEARVMEQSACGKEKSSVVSQSAELEHYQTCSRNRGSGREEQMLQLQIVEFAVRSGR